MFDSYFFILLVDSSRLNGNHFYKVVCAEYEPLPDIISTEAYD